MRVGAVLTTPGRAGAARWCGPVSETGRCTRETTLHRRQLRWPPLVEQAMGCQASALVAMLDAECANAQELNDAASVSFQQHPDHAIITSFQDSPMLLVPGCWPRSATTAAASPTHVG